MRTSHLKTEASEGLEPAPLPQDADAVCDCHPYCEGTVTAAVAAEAVGATATPRRGATIWRVFGQRSGTILGADRVDAAGSLPMRESAGTSCAIAAADTIWLDACASIAAG